MSPTSEAPRRFPKASEWIREAADRLFGNWAGEHKQGIERLRLALRARQSAAEAYLDEEQQRREAFERDLLERLKRVEDMAHHPRAGF